MRQELILAPMGDINAYIQSVNQIPILSLEDELRLGRELQINKNLSAAKQLIVANLRYVVKIAYLYKGYGLNLSDLIQEGTIGLMKAVKRYDPAQKVKLITFAVYWVKAEIHEFIMRNWRIVKVATTKAQRKLFFNLRKNKKNLGYLSAAEIKTLSTNLGVATDTVQEMEIRLNAHDTSFDAPINDSHPFIPQLYLEDNRYDPANLIENDNAHDYHQEQIKQAFTKLDDRSQIIISERWLNEKKSTLQELATKFQVSAERVRQLEKSALHKLKNALASQVKSN